MALKHTVELNEKELKELICKHYGLNLYSATIRISQLPSEYNQGTYTTVKVEATAIEKKQYQTTSRFDHLDKSISDSIKNR